MFDDYTKDDHDDDDGDGDPILDTRISASSFSFSVTLRVPPLYSEMGWTGELWSKTKFLILEN